ncbi:MAG TPA: hypothetical protein VIU11_06770 [Nakamurella sp.]
MNVLAASAGASSGDSSAMVRSGRSVPIISAGYRVGAAGSSSAQ